MTRELSAILEERLRKFIFPKELPELYDPVSYTLSIGGKRLRPYLLMLSARMFGATEEESINQALAVEMFHNFTLVHDDIMDNAPLRRGKPTVFKKWDMNTAILAGDVMLSMSMQEAMKCPTDIQSGILETFLDMTVRVCEGQQMDMNFEKKEMVELREYIHMIELKTAYLMAGSLKIGAQLGRQDSLTCDMMFEYGMKAGTAFQLIDDYLDAYGDPEKFGKKIGGDILEGKKTFLFIETHNKLPAKERKEFLEIFNSDSLSDAEKVKRIKKYFEESGSRNSILKVADRLLNECSDIIAKVDGQPEAKEELINLTRKLTDRDI